MTAGKASTVPSFVCESWNSITTWLYCSVTDLVLISSVPAPLRLRCPHSSHNTDTLFPGLFLVSLDMIPWEYFADTTFDEPPGNLIKYGTKPICSSATFPTFSRSLKYASSEE